MQYRKASIADLEILTEVRIKVLRAANKLSEDVDMSEIERQTCEYCRQALPDGTHTAYLVFDGESLAGAGAVSYFRVMPPCHNPSGKKAYIMNMYTEPDYRRRGVAFKTLELLVADAMEKGVSAISLEATEMGRPLYEKFGFVKMNSEMELPEDWTAPVLRR